MSQMDMETAGKLIYKLTQPNTKNLFLAIFVLGVLLMILYLVYRKTCHIAEAAKELEMQERRMMPHSLKSSMAYSGLMQGEDSQTEKMDGATDDIQNTEYETMLLNTGMDSIEDSESYETTLLQEGTEK